MTVLTKLSSKTGRKTREVGRDNKINKRRRSPSYASYAQTTFVLLHRSLRFQQKKSFARYAIKREKCCCHRREYRSEGDQNGIQDRVPCTQKRREGKGALHRKSPRFKLNILYSLYYVKNLLNTNLLNK